jgi:hypothetical protein
MASACAIFAGFWDCLNQTFVIGRIMNTGTEFNLMVDYGRSINDSLTAGYYDIISDAVEKEDYPPEEHERGEKKLHFKIIHLNRESTTEEVEQQMARRKCRVATPRELLAFAEAHPELQNQFPVIALGSPKVNDAGQPVVLVLWSYGGKRGISQNRSDTDWAKGNRFLAVRK